MNFRETRARVVPPFAREDAPKKQKASKKCRSWAKRLKQSQKERKERCSYQSKKIEGKTWCFHRSFNVYVSVSVIGFFEVEHARVFCAGVGAGQRSRVPSKRPCVGAHVDFFVFTMREGHPRGHLPGDTLLQPVGPGNWTKGKKTRPPTPEIRCL